MSFCLKVIEKILLLLFSVRNSLKKNPFFFECVAVKSFWNDWFKLLAIRMILSFVFHSLTKMLVLKTTNSPIPDVSHFLNFIKNNRETL